MVDYFEWLGGQFSSCSNRREKIEAAAEAIHAHETNLTNAMLHGIGNLPGLANMDGVSVIGGIENSRREGLVSLNIEGVADAEVVQKLSDPGHPRSHPQGRPLFREHSGTARLAVLCPGVHVPLQYDPRGRAVSQRL